ncbi:acyl-CoA dehydrogenase [Maritimibacter sp. UBA3975]|uniref:acyl-CoA dehydrogenase family protein n=1 Tax=Maritimibacter sp. UBA3975 TaxID=1946833 RepID=UPI000C0999CF|nr:acyl-CoA dehydrogenase [Maritimibacter sp. UBA3975]MAM63933.1 acyl-CoA dehydrogenase [Maritimibacter sp.]|tara:strand:+ start:6956 stop:8014 length:1059 start_codon:yes stop_codon:yes gene_type:complete
MDFTLTEDRRMLSDSLSRFLADKYTYDHRAKVAYEAPFHDAGLWSEMCEIGVLYALAPEDAGGFGGGGFDITTVFEALGRGLSPAPVLGTLLASKLLTAAGADQSALLDGSVRYAVAIGELDAPYDLDGIATEASGGTLTGRKSVVYGGNDAEVFLVAAKSGDGLAIYEVKASDADVTGYGLIDGGGAAELFLDKTPGTEVLANARDALEDALDAGRLALCAEAVGAMDATNEILLDYLRTRKQFGVPIGKFQALQHRAVDLVTEIEQARSITIFAASRMGEADQARSVSMAKTLIGRAARLVSEEAIQMHGGIAMTWEASVSHYGKRLVMIDAQLGDVDYNLERVMAGYAA